LKKGAYTHKFQSKENAATAQNHFGIVVFDFPLLFYEFLGIVLLETITKL
jgi:hypothetical protein